MIRLIIGFVLLLRCLTVRENEGTCRALTKQPIGPHNSVCSYTNLGDLLTSESSMNSLFLDLDDDGNGLVSVEELKNVMRILSLLRIHMPYQPFIRVSL